MSAHDLLIACFTMAILLLCARNLQAIQEAINNFSNHFRGGPPPTHPLPANDAFLLRRRRLPRQRIEP
ncbi:MAG TPA: hypothetical protein VKU19_16760 [Bryobacteraceae bacterium]|nr:hypothetical protein [Bryobacteraceae bacterium]